MIVIILDFVFYLLKSSVPVAAEKEVPGRYQRIHVGLRKWLLVISHGQCRVDEFVGDTELGVRIGDLGEDVHQNHWLFILTIF